MTINTERLYRMNSLIRKEMTGNPSSFAETLDVSVSTVYRTIAFMKESGAPIKYDRINRTYYYEQMGHLKFAFIPDKDKSYKKRKKEEKERSQYLNIF